jgi:hypothetical protein
LITADLSAAGVRILLDGMRGYPAASSSVPSGTAAGSKPPILSPLSPRSTFARTCCQFIARSFRLGTATTMIGFMFRLDVTSAERSHHAESGDNIAERSVLVLEQRAHRRALHKRPMSSKL